MYLILSQSLSTSKHPILFGITAQMENLAFRSYTIYEGDIEILLDRNWKIDPNPFDAGGEGWQECDDKQ